MTFTLRDKLIQLGSNHCALPHLLFTVLCYEIKYLIDLLLRRSGDTIIILLLQQEENIILIILLGTKNTLISGG